MNSPYLPPAAYGDAAALLKIFRELGDPAAAQKRLDELSEQVATISRLNAETRELAKQAAADRAANEKLLDELASARESQAATLKRIQDARLDQREADLAVRERKVAESERVAAASLAEGNALKAKWQTRVEKLKAAQADVD